MTRDILPSPWDGGDNGDAGHPGQPHDAPALEKSRLYKLKVDLLTKLQSAPPQDRQGIVERLQEIDRRIKKLRLDPAHPAKIPSSAG